MCYSRKWWLVCQTIPSCYCRSKQRERSPIIGAPYLPATPVRHRDDRSRYLERCTTPTPFAPALQPFASGAADGLSMCGYQDHGQARAQQGARARHSGAAAARQHMRVPPQAPQTHGAAAYAHYSVPVNTLTPAAPAQDAGWSMPSLPADMFRPDLAQAVPPPPALSPHFAPPRRHNLPGDGDGNTPQMHAPHAGWPPMPTRPGGSAAQPPPRAQLLSFDDAQVAFLAALTNMAEQHRGAPPTAAAAPPAPAAMVASDAESAVSQPLGESDVDDGGNDDAVSSPNESEPEAPGTEDVGGAGGGVGGGGGASRESNVTVHAPLVAVGASAGASGGRCGPQPGYSDTWTLPVGARTKQRAARRRAPPAAAATPALRPAPQKAAAAPPLPPPPRLGAPPQHRSYSPFALNAAAAAARQLTPPPLPTPPPQRGGFAAMHPCVMMPTPTGAALQAPLQRFPTPPQGHYQPCAPIFDPRSNDIAQLAPQPPPQPCRVPLPPFLGGANASAPDNTLTPALVQPASRLSWDLGRSGQINAAAAAAAPPHATFAAQLAAHDAHDLQPCRKRSCEMNRWVPPSCSGVYGDD